jgi:hypothetical protein
MNRTNKEAQPSQSLTHPSQIETGNILNLPSGESQVKTTAMPNGKIYELCPDGIYREKNDRKDSEPDWRKIVRFRTPSERYRSRKIGRLIAQYLNTPDDTGDVTPQIQIAQSLKQATGAKADGLVVASGLENFKQAHRNRDSKLRTVSSEELLLSIGMVTARVRREAQTVAMDNFAAPIYAMTRIAEIQDALQAVSILYPPHYRTDPNGRQHKVVDNNPVASTLRKWLERKREEISPTSLPTHALVDKAPQIVVPRQEKTKRTILSTRIAADPRPRNTEEVLVEKTPWSEAERARLAKFMSDLFPDGMEVVTDPEKLYAIKGKFLNTIPYEERSIRGVPQMLPPRDRPFRRILKLIDERVKQLQFTE